MCIDGYGGSSSGECTPCPAGTYGQGLGIYQPCLPCSGGKQYSNTTASITCSTCTGELIADSNHTGCVSPYYTCPDGQGGSVTNNKCSVCPAGSAGQGLLSNQPCTQCVGQKAYSNASGSAVCSQCEGGLIANPGHTGCIGELLWVFHSFCGGQRGADQHVFSGVGGAG